VKKKKKEKDRGERKRYRGRENKIGREHARELNRHVVDGHVN